jgi:hypothetical protein
LLPNGVKGYRNTKVVCMHDPARLVHMQLSNSSSAYFLHNDIRKTTRLVSNRPCLEQFIAKLAAHLLSRWLHRRSKKILKERGGGGGGNVYRRIISSPKLRTRRETLTRSNTNPACTPQHLFQRFLRFSHQHHTRARTKKKQIVTG